MEELGRTIMGIIGLIVAVAIVALLVSKNANTAGVIQATASGLGNNLGVAESPVTGASYHIDLAYPGGGGGNVYPGMG